MVAASGGVATTRAEAAAAGRLAPWVWLYFAATVIPLAVIGTILRIWSLDLSVPFDYGEDALLNLPAIKGWLETGSYFTNPSLGAPGIAQYFDYPYVDPFSYLVVRALGLFVTDAATAANLYYLLSYPLVGLAATAALHRLGLTRSAALAFGVLYAVLPYHWMRSEKHLWLSMYWVVPLLVLVAAWVASDRPPFVSNRDGRWRLDLRSRRTVVTMLICGAGAATGAYYLFFGCFFILLAGLRSWLADGSRRSIASGLIVVSFAGALFLLQLAPNLAYVDENGRLPMSAYGETGLDRNPSQAEIFGTRITYLLLPQLLHRVPALSAVTNEYFTFSHYAQTEAYTSALGIVGAAGLLLVLLAFLLGWPRLRGREPTGVPAPGLGWLGYLSVAAILLATSSGFGTVLSGVLYAAEIPPVIRAYNRISLFLAFFAFLGIALLIQAGLARLGEHRAWFARRGAPIMFAVVAAIGVLDQTPANLESPVGVATPREFDPGLTRTRETYLADVAFGRQLQAKLPEGTVIFQLPYVSFPEVTVPGMGFYDPLRGYLATRGYRWSFGAMRGREDAAWNEAAAALPVAGMVDRVRARGFGAIWVQGSGYADGGTAMSRQLSELLGPPLVSNGTFAVWEL